MRIGKSRYGFGGNDEAFYLTVPHRVSMGDSFIVDEWHLSQLSGFLLLPFVSIYTTIFGSTEGIISAARIVYLLLHTAVSVIIYARLRRFGLLTVFASVLYFIFTPFNIMAMSYNTMGLDLVVLSGIIMATYSCKKKIPMILSGLCFAAAVLCNPYLAAVYLLYMICVGIHHLIAGKKYKFVLSSKMFSVKTFLWFTVGTAILAAAFAAFELMRADLESIIESLPYLMTDPDHPQMSVLSKLGLYFSSIYNFNESFKYALCAYGLMMIVMIFDKKRRLHRSLYLIISAALTVFCYVLIVPDITASSYNSVMFPIIFMGITSYILIKNKPRKLFASLFVYGIIYSIAMTFSSNQYFYVISMAIGAANIASLVFVSILLRELKEYEDNFDYALLLKRSAFTAVAVVIAAQSFLQIKSKAEHCFWESGMDTLTTEISSGPAKGILTTSANAAEYEQIYSDLTYYNDKGDENILILSEKTWCYLAAYSKPYGTLSAWISGETQTSLNRLETYYEVNPDKIPKYIYIPKSSSWNNIEQIVQNAENYGYTVTSNNISYKLEKLQ